MTKTIFVMLLLILGCQAFTQQHQYVPEGRAMFRTGDSVVVIHSRPNILKTNLAGIFSLFYEGQVSTKRSLQISINYADIGFLWEDTKYISFTPALKFYLSKKVSTARRPSPSGFYVSPYLRYVNIHDIGNSFSGRKLSEVAHNLFGAGVLAGYQLIFRKGLTLDFFGGGGYLPLGSSQIVYTYARDYDVDVSREEFKADIRLGICIGYAIKKTNKSTGIVPNQ